MITEDEYKNAIKVIIAYQNQVKLEIENTLILSKKEVVIGDRVKILKKHPNSKLKTGDVITIVDLHYSSFYKGTFLRYIDSNGKKKSIIKERGWDYEVLK